MPERREMGPKSDGKSIPICRLYVSLSRCVYTRGDGGEAQIDGAGRDAGERKRGKGRRREAAGMRIGEGLGSGSGQGWLRRLALLGWRIGGPLPTFEDRSCKIRFK